MGCLWSVVEKGPVVVKGGVVRKRLLSLRILDSRSCLNIEEPLFILETMGKVLESWFS